jgi:hypothetical protein
MTEQFSSIAITAIICGSISATVVTLMVIGNANDIVRAYKRWLGVRECLFCEGTGKEGSRRCGRCNATGTDPEQG